MKLFCDKWIFFLFFIFLTELRASDEKKNNDEIRMQITPGMRVGFVAYGLSGVITAVVRCALFCIDKVLNYLDHEELASLQEKENSKMLESVPESYVSVSTDADIEEVFEAFFSNFKNIIEQDKAKEEIMDQFFAHFIKIKEHEIRPEPKRRGPGVEFYCLVGQPGLGKTQSSNALARSYSLGQESKEVFTIDASTLLNPSAGGKRGVVFLTSLVPKKKGEYTYFTYSEFIALLKTAKHPVIIFNEIDKLLAEEDLQKETSEFLRSLLEEGYIKTETGEKIDCSGLTVIFTSNNAKMFTDPSMNTRFNMVFFEKFSQEGYSMIFKKYFEDFLKRYNRVLENRESLFSFKLSEECYNEIAAEVYKDASLSSMGARCYSLFVSKMAGFLTREVRAFSSSKQENIKVSATGNGKSKKGIVQGENIIGYKDGDFFFV